MKIRTILCAAVVAATAGMAQAFPEYTVYPADGNTLDEVSYFDSFNLTFSSAVTVIGEPTATLVALETGDTYNSTTFATMAGMGMPELLMIKFDGSAIKDNGKYAMTIPADSFSVDGENNPKITLNYTLNDANLDKTEWPQIELVSVNPEAESKFPKWGTDEFSKIYFTTSNDAAVNYIEWVLNDLNAPEDEQYVVSGNNNRYDLNRYGNKNDAWADGLFIDIAGDIALIKDHKYALSLTFCGIGYDVETNQYPNPTQIESSKELETVVYYYGLTEPPTYSEYTVASITPDPANYEITTADFTFTVQYTGPVKPGAFTYSQGPGMLTSAGTWKIADGVDDNDGFATTWDFTFTPSVIESVTGELYVNIQAKDADGLDVKGSGEFLFDNVNYGITWQCNVGADQLSSVNPADFAEVTSLSEIILSNHPYNNPSGAPKEMIINDDATVGDATIVTKMGVVRTLAKPVAVDDGATQMKFTFEEITEPGTYKLMIPKSYFNLGDQFLSTSCNETIFTYIIPKASESNVEYDLLPLSVTPEDEATVAELTSFVLDYGTEDVCGVKNDSYELNKAAFYEVTDEGDVLIEEILTEEDFNFDTFEVKYIYTLSSPVTEAGTYKLVVPQSTIGDATYDQDPDHANGRANPELIYTVTVGESGVQVLFNGFEGKVTVVTVNGVVLKADADASCLANLPAGLYIVNGRKYIVK